MIRSAKILYLWAREGISGTSVADLTVEHAMPWPPTRHVWDEVSKMVREKLEAGGLSYDRFAVAAITPIAELSADAAAEPAAPADHLDIQPQQAGT